MIPTFKLIRAEDLQQDPTAFVNTFNLFGKQLQTLFQGNITLGENVRGQQISQSFSTPSNFVDGSLNNFPVFSFSTSFTGVSSVIIGDLWVPDSGTYVINTKPVTLPIGGWRETKAGTIQINYITGLSPSTNYSVMFLVF